MATITQQIPNYHGGISQQADEVKAPGQVNKLKNAIPDVVQGLVKRPGTKLLTAAGNIAKIDHDKWFHYYRDETEQYIGRIDRSTGDIKMWGKDGSTKTVVYDSGTQTAIKNYLRYPYVSGTIDNNPYLENGSVNTNYNPVPTEDEIQTLTINDYTYLTNRNVTVKMDKAATTDSNSVGYNPVRPPEAYIELKKVAYARQYAVNLFDDNTTQDVKTATRISVKSSSLNTVDSSCPNVGTEIFNVGTGDDYALDIKNEFLFKAIHGYHQGGSNFFETDLTLTYRLHYCPPRWTPNTFYRVGDLVTGKPTDASDESSNHTRVYQLKVGSTAGKSTGTAAPIHTSSDAAIGDHTWTHITDTTYTANANTFADPSGNGGAGSGATSQTYHGLPCITLTDSRNVISETTLTALITAWKDTTSNPNYAHLPFVFDDQELWNSGTTQTTTAELGINWKHFGYYDDQIDRIILERPGGTGGGQTIGGSTVDLVTGVGEVEVKTTGWSTDIVLGAGRSDLYFRLTTTGQAVPNSDASVYTCRYTTTIDLLHGGSGWEVGDRIRVKMKDGTHVIQVDKTSTSKEQANLALVRPSPTSFDTKTTVTAESIIGSIREEIIDHNTFSYVQNNGSGGAGQLITITKPGHGLTADDDIDVEFLDPNSGTKPNNFSGNILAITTDTIIFATDTTSQQISGKCILDFTNTNVRQVGNGLYVTRTNNKFGISTSDSDLLNVFTNEIQDVADLPSQCKHDYKLKVRNSEEEADDYYLKFIGQEKQDGTFLDGKGVWEECAEPGRNIKLDYSTMPITLIRTKDGNFRVAQLDGGYYHFAADVKTGVYTSNTNTNSILFGLTNHGFEVGDVVRIEQGDSSGGTIPAAYYTIDLVSGTNNFYVTSDANIGNNGALNCKVYPTYSHKKWAECTVGSWNDKSFTGTVPEPSFVNYKINKVISFRNRLGILSDENVNLSRPGDFDDFWPISAIAYSAGDNIDVSCSSIHPAILYDAIEINTGLLLFSENEQFMLTTDSDVLSPLTAKINSFCTYNFNKKTSPISLGTTVGFLDNASRYSRFFEATNLAREGTPDVFEQSKIVSRLLPKELTLIANSRENSIIFFSERGSKTVYGLKYLTGGDRRLQQAWFTWEMSSPIQHMALMDDALYFILRENTTTTWDGSLTYSDTIQKIKLKLDDDSSYLLDLGAEGSEWRNITDNDILYNVHLDNYVRLDYNDFHDRNPDLLFTIPAAFNKTNLHAKYTRSNGSTICFIYRNSHGFKTGQKVYIDFVDNSLVSGTIPTDNEFTVTLHTENYFQITIPTGNAVQGICRVTAILGVVEAQNEPGSDSTWDFSQNGRYGKVIPYDDTGTLKGKAKGNWTTISDGDNEGVYLGYLFDMEVEFPTIYPVKTANNNIISDYTGGLVIHRVKLNLGHHAIHEVELERGWPNRYFGSSVITSRDKTTYNEALGPLTSDTPPVVATDYYSASYVMHFKEEGQQVIPIYEKNKNLTLTFKSTSPSPATLYSMTWEGDYTNNHYERVT